MSGSLRIITETAGERRAAKRKARSDRLVWVAFMLAYVTLAVLLVFLMLSRLLAGGA